MRKTLGVAAAVVLLAACELSVAPAQTDSRIDRALDDHVVAFDEKRPLGEQLFVFLPGTGGTPEAYTALLRAVASQGTPAIGLMYPNSRAVNRTLCANDGSEPDCFEQVREEVVYGRNTSSHVAISPANSIVNRLVQLLRHLEWTQFLNGNEPRWDRIVIAGHSQGGGHAAMIARDNEVARVAFFAAPGDWSGGGPAPWLLEPSTTPIDRYYGFVHDDDGLTFALNWAAMGLPGASTSVDGATSPFGGAHRLTTAADVSNPHGAVARDASRYADVWHYLCCG